MYVCHCLIIQIHLCGTRTYVHIHMWEVVLALFNSTCVALNIYIYMHILAHIHIYVHT